MAGLLQAGPAHLESVWCAISHPNTWESITWGHFHHFQAPIQGSRGPKMAILWLNPGPNGRGGSRLDRSTWKVSGAPYHTPSHGRASLGAIFVISRYLSRGPDVQKIAIIYIPLAKFFWGSERYDTISWDLIRCYTIF